MTNTNAEYALKFDANVRNLRRVASCERELFIEPLKLPKIGTILFSIDTNMQLEF